jgi:uncharacterized protein (UPF0218 family)
MSMAYVLTPETRRRLKQPLGQLVRGSYVETTNRIKEMIAQESPPKVISVGDTVSKNLMSQHVHIQLSITDNKVMRKSVQPSLTPVDRTIHTVNPPGTITEEAILAIRRALTEQDSVRIVVDGEEDLLALVAISYAPEGSLVIYGQPYEGVVVVKAALQKKAEVAEILKAMENARKAK